MYTIPSDLEKKENKYRDLENTFSIRELSVTLTTLETIFYLLDRISHDLFSVELCSHVNAWTQIVLLPNQELICPWSNQTLLKVTRVEMSVRGILDNVTFCLGRLRKRTFLYLKFHRRPESVPQVFGTDERSCRRLSKGHFLSRQTVNWWRRLLRWNTQRVVREKWLCITRFPWRKAKCMCVLHDKVHCLFLSPVLRSERDVMSKIISEINTSENNHSKHIRFESKITGRMIFVTD